ncbi:CDP-diacylglycerol pyrophosphatase [Nonomuraea maritima]|uniref:CDP-diacylglycerol diphosphatase n=1 Tax=Nonomuraea maritima TaxID=683260 RepID=A0A1G9HQW0_9ACTN|nr:CDP-diacylglycerol pyrophosphatase [Nonomuraea maritima]
MGENGVPETAADGLSRRHFVRASGLTGAGVVLSTACQIPALASDTPPPPPTAGGPDPTVCGSPNSMDRLWVSMQRCHGNNSCLQNGDDYVVMPGNNNTSGYTNFILVPTQRINGIECPWICNSHAPNYWDAAAYFATRPPTVVRTPVGLGINSQRARTFNQLHIHMATARPVSRNDLEAQQSIAARNIPDWAHTRVSVRGFSEQLGVLPHVYRVLIWPGFSHDNLFDMLRTMLVHALGQGATVADAQEQMRFQTLIVIPRTSGGYFIVNSETQLRDPNNHQLAGTNTCDPLLLLHP